MIILWDYLEKVKVELPQGILSWLDKVYVCCELFEEQIKKIKSKKIINKYETMRNNTLSYLIQNEKEITFKLSRSR